MTWPGPPRRAERGARRSRATERVDAALRSAISLLVDQGIGPGARILIGVSGGQDSLCLAHALWRLGPEHNWLLQVVHVDHGIRPEAQREGAFVATLATAWSLPVEVLRVDVPTYRRRARLNHQQAARYARYQAFAREAARSQAVGVLVAHTADDVAETLLLHLVRGAGLDGLAASPLVQSLPGTALGPPVDGTPGTSPLNVIRPLLAVPRADTGAYCAEQGLQPVGEPPGRYQRDRLRHDLLPVLEQYNPSVRGALSRAAFALAEDRAALDQFTETACLHVVERESNAAAVIALDEWTRLPVAIRKRLLRRLARELGGAGAELDQRTLGAAMRLVRAQPGRRIHLPGGLRLERRRDRLWLGPQAEPPAPPAGPWSLPVPGSVVLSGVGAVRAERRTVDPAPNAIVVVGSRRNEAWLDAESVHEPLQVRWRQPGDRFQPLGMEQFKRLQDFLVDSGVPQARRDRLPLVVAHDEIAWVTGERIAHWARLRPGTRDALHLTFEPMAPGDAGPQS